MRIANKFISEIFLVTLAVNIRANKRRLGLFIFLGSFRAKTFLSDTHQPVPNSIHKLYKYIRIHLKVC